VAESPTNARIVLTTVASAGEASRIGRALVSERLVACATILPSVESIYEWQGKTELATETLMLLKTDTERIPALEARLHALHSYETPEFLVLPVEAGSTGYLNWMQSVLGGRMAE
jgi:periplasmic divalent cation tolerance protein